MVDPRRLIVATMVALTGCGERPSARTGTVAVVAARATPTATTSVGRKPPVATAPARPRVFDPEAVLQDDANLRPLPPAPIPASRSIRAPTDAEWQAAQNDR
jgi:hypothetical protein